MRVTDNMFDLYRQRDLARAQQRMLAAQQQATSGLAVERASDDPVAAGRLIELDAAQRASGQYRDNLVRASGELETADTALNSISELLLQARELGQQMANGTMTAEDRALAQDQLAGLREQLIVLANTEHAGQQIFAGHQTDDNAFDAAGAYQGDDSQRAIEAGDGLRLPVGVSGREVLGDGSSGVMAVIDDLSAALASGDSAAIASAATAVGEGRDQVVETRARIGNQWQRVDAQLGVLEASILQGQAERSRLTEVGAVEALSEVMEAQQSLQRSIEVSSQLLNSMSLVGKL